MTLCPHFGVCGGCSHQDQPYADQLLSKDKLVRDTLKDIPIRHTNPIFSSPDQFFYRNKMEFSFGDAVDVLLLKKPKGEQIDLSRAFEPGKNVIHAGLHPKKRFNLVIPTPDCRLLSPEAQTIMKIVSDWATRHQIPSYVRMKNTGVLRHLVIREGKNMGERLVKLVATTKVSKLDDLAELLKNSGVPITTFLYMAHDGLSDNVQGEVKNIFWGEGFINERVQHVTLRVPHQSFMQTNTHASEKLMNQLGDWIEKDKETAESTGNLIDLYCGVGVMGLCLAAHFETVVGIESDERAIEEACLNAHGNNISNITFHLAQVEDWITRTVRLPERATVIVDPPRSGLNDMVARAILRLSPAHLYYVSCNPDSLARDLRLLETKYNILDVQPMDFFPHTDHVETAVRMELKT